MRFWVINTNVDRKIASTDANVAKPTKVGSKFAHGAHPELVKIQSPNISKWTYTKVIDPVNRVPLRPTAVGVSACAPRVGDVQLVPGCFAPRQLANPD